MAGMELRCGRKVGRTLYLQPEGSEADDGLLIGLMDTPELAAFAVAAVNTCTAGHPAVLAEARASLDDPGAWNADGHEVCLEDGLRVGTMDTAQLAGVVMWAVRTYAADHVAEYEQALASLGDRLAGHRAAP